jgi:hypothetical protein
MDATLAETVRVKYFERCSREKRQREQAARVDSQSDHLLAASKSPRKIVSDGCFFELDCDVRWGGYVISKMSRKV